MSSANTFLPTSSLLYELQQLLIQIKTCNDVNDAEAHASVSFLASHSLSLLHYALFAIENQQTSLPFTSVSAGAALFDVMHELRPLAKAYGATLHFDASPNLEPVYTNETSLKGSIFALLSGVITSSANGIAPDITIAVQQTKPNEQRVGIYSRTTPMSATMLKKSQRAQAARMHASGVTHRSGLGFLVSGILADRINTSFSPFVHKDASGLGFYVPESAQLSLL